MCGNFYGPLEVYTNMWTTLRFASIRPSDVEWDRFLLVQKQDVDFLFHMFGCLPLIPNYHARVKVRTSLTKYVVELGWPVRDRYPIIVSHSSHIQPVKTWFHDALKALSRQTKYWSAFLKERTIVVAKSTPLWKRHIMNVQSYVSRFDVRSLKHLSHLPMMKVASHGFDMVRVPLCLNFPSDHDSQGSRESTHAACFAWSKIAGVCIA
eukprot:3123591-Karenia_brevis.AAC.1